MQPEPAKKILDPGRIVLLEKRTSGLPPSPLLRDVFSLSFATGRESMVVLPPFPGERRINPVFSSLSPSSGVAQLGLRPPPFVKKGRKK